MGLIRDLLDVHDDGDAAARAARAGQWFSDPGFGSRVLRVTDDTHGKRCNHAYSYWPALSCDSHYLLIARDDVPWLYVWDPHGEGAYIPLRPLREFPSEGKLQFEGATWSRLQPSHLYALTDEEKPLLYRVNVSQKAWTLRSTLLAELVGGVNTRHLTVSAGAGVFCYLADGPTGKPRVCVYTTVDEATHIFNDVQGRTVNEAQIARNGKHVLVNFEPVEPGKPGPAALWAFRRKSNAVTELPNPGGHWHAGDAFLVNGDGIDTGVQSRTYANPTMPYNVFQYQVPTSRRAGGKRGPLNWHIAEHVSLGAGGESSALVSTYAVKRQGDPFEDELILVATGPVRSWARVGHTFSRQANPVKAERYYAQPRACLSLDGRWMVWSSDVGDTTGCHVLMARTPEGFI